MGKETASKKQLAYDSIKEMILNNELKPGEAIAERKICESLGISRTPIRAALTDLSKEGLVEITEGHGVSVSKMRFDDMIELYDIREALECMSMTLLPDRITPEELEHLQAILAEMESLSGAEFMSMDMTLHTTMALYTKNKRLAQNVNTIYSPIRLIASTAQNDRVLCAAALQEHREILQAIADQDTDAAVEAMRRHIRNVKEYHIKKYFLFSSPT